MTPELTAAGAARAIACLEDAWTTDPQVLGRARALELSGWTFHLAGRVGLLGDDIHPETVVAMLGTVAPDAVRTGWEVARRLGPSMIARARMAECACWGAAHLAEVCDANLARLLQRVVDEADATAMPVFAATRRMLTCDGSQAPGALVALMVHALSEHRGAAMLMACRAVGLSPLELLIAGPEGVPDAIAAGWSPPFPARLSVLRRYVAAGTLADRITGAAYASLEMDERDELVAGLNNGVAAVASGL